MTFTALADALPAPQIDPATAALTAGDEPRLRAIEEKAS